MALGILLLIPFLMSIVSPFVGRNSKLSFWFFALAPISVLIWLFSQWKFVSMQETLNFRFGWISSLGLDATFRLDGLSLLFLYLIFGIGGLVVLYAKSYLRKQTRLGEFYSYLFFFMGSMAGAVLADNTLLLFIFWELTSLASFLLIGFHYDKASSRAAALQALLITGGGGLALLAGLIMVSQIAGSFEIQNWIQNKAVILSHPWLTPALSLILIGAFTKSAQMPFHFWLPSAMAAPTPVSAYLHSATMVKLGVYLVARLSPVFSEAEIWKEVLVPVGILTAFFGSLMAIKQTDLKKLLAYSTISALGLLMTLLGIGSDEAIHAAVVYLFVHSLYKGALFMVVGAIDHQSGSRDIGGLSGLVRVMPVTAIAAFLAALSMAGFPPLFGFIGKELLYQAKFAQWEGNFIFYFLAFAANILNVVIAFMVGAEPFLGRQVQAPKMVKEAGGGLLVGPCVLALLGLFFAIDPKQVVQPLLSFAASSVSGHPQNIYISLWHGFNLVLILSLLTLAGGFWLFLLRKRLRKGIQRMPDFDPYGPERAYDWALRALPQISGWQTRALQSGSLTRYMELSLLAVVMFLAYLFLEKTPQMFGPLPLQLSFSVSILLVLIAIAALAATVARSRVFLAACMGVVGFGIAVFYALFSAPDLALTQILVETLSVILVVFLISKIPSAKNPISQKSESRKVVLSSVFGLLMAALAIAGMREQAGRSSISQFFAENSYLEAKGRNIVNVILVDFRALDTLGEATVLMIAALGVASLLKGREA